MERLEGLTTRFWRTFSIMRELELCFWTLMCHPHILQNEVLLWITKCQLRCLLSWVKRIGTTLLLFSMVLLLGYIEIIKVKLYGPYQDNIFYTTHILNIEIARDCAHIHISTYNGDLKTPSLTTLSLSPWSNHFKARRLNDLLTVLSATHCCISS